MYYSDSEDKPVQEITPNNLTLDFVKNYLRVDHEFDDVEIEVCMKSAIAYVKKYIKQPEDEDLDYELIIPILALTSHYYENKNPVAKANEKVDALIQATLEMNRGNIL